MKRTFAGFMGLCLAALLALVLTFNLVAKDKAPKVSNVQGKVQSIKKDASTITISNGTVPRQVMYSGDTKFMYGHSKDNKPGAIDQVKEGYFISCAGMVGANAAMTAKECVYRKTK